MKNMKKMLIVSSALMTAAFASNVYAYGELDAKAVFVKGNTDGNTFSINKQGGKNNLKLNLENLGNNSDRECNIHLAYKNGKLTLEDSGNKADATVASEYMEKEFSMESIYSTLRQILSKSTVSTNAISKDGDIEISYDLTSGSLKAKYKGVDGQYKSETNTITDKTVVNGQNMKNVIGTAVNEVIPGLFVEIDRLKDLFQLPKKSNVVTVEEKEFDAADASKTKFKYKVEEKEKDVPAEVVKQAFVDATSSITSADDQAKIDAAVDAGYFKNEEEAKKKIKDITIKVDGDKTKVAVRGEKEKDSINKKLDDLKKEAQETYDAKFQSKVLELVTKAMEAKVTISIDKDGKVTLDLDGEKKELSAEEVAKILGENAAPEKTKKVSSEEQVKAFSDGSYDKVSGMRVLKETGKNDELEISLGENKIKIDLAEFNAAKASLTQAKIDEGKKDPSKLTKVEKQAYVTKALVENGILDCINYGDNSDTEKEDKKDKEAKKEAKKQKKEDNENLSERQDKNIKFAGIIANPASAASNVTSSTFTDTVGQRISEVSPTAVAAGDDPTTKIGLWAKLSAGVAKQKKILDLAPYQVTNVGLAIGADFQATENVIFGAGLLYISPNVKYTTSAELDNKGNSKWFRKDSGNGFGFTAYGLFAIDQNWSTDAGLMYMRTNYKSKYSGDDKLKSKFHTDSFLVNANVKYAYSISDTAKVTPKLGMQYIHSCSSKYKLEFEGNKLMDMEQGKRSNDNLALVVGAEVANVVDMSSGVVVTPNLHANFSYDLISKMNNTKATFTNVDDYALSLKSGKLGKWGVNIGAGAKVAHGNIDLEGGVDFNLGKKYHAVSSSLKLKVNL